MILLTSVTMKQIIDAMLLFPPVFKDVAIIGIFLGLVEISPLKLNPWKWLRAFVALPSRLEALEHEFNDDRAFRWRSQILRRADYILSGEKFSRETWEDTKDTIKRYKKYCENNPEYENGKAVFAIDLLNNKYDEAIANNDVLDKDNYVEVLV